MLGRSVVAMLAVAATNAALGVADAAAGLEGQRSAQHKNGLNISFRIGKMVE